eukprot:TRINITY_DN2427_c1_g1_i2.p1 TRINITY_DN2427_c1_g1~~TRINITY_DN2427_c1_g1_i2.p1  ORF type:complete len:523 (+),score=80.82 TRINITY_DN2427_c1_g1_i2:62-1570(+)
MSVAIIAVLVFLSQTFTGLNIGLMSLDTAQLQVLIEVPNKDEAALEAAKYARRILPLRQKGNLLLCTILLGNTGVNALMAILLGEFAGGLVGWLTTTVVIVLLCEILPQSVCTRHGLRLGAKGAPIIRTAMFFFYPITKPYALILDRLFPQRENLLDRSQLRNLVEYQQAAMPGMLAVGQAQMLIGALGVAQRTAGEVMVPMEQVCKIGLDDKLTYELIASIVRKGFSRFPVVDSETGQVKGLLHCKDLLLKRYLETAYPHEGGSPRAGENMQDEHDVQTVQDLLEDIRAAEHERKVFICGRNTTLMTLLSEFKRRPHLAIVADSEEPGEITEPTRHVGIVTLQNIFQIILQAPKDTYFDEASAYSPRRLHRQAGAASLMDKRRLWTMAKNGQQLGEDEAEAVRSLLVSTEKCFAPDRIAEEELLQLLQELRVRPLARRDELYSRGQAATFATLVLQGALRVVSGEDRFESTVGPWICLGTGALCSKGGSGLSSTQKNSSNP